MKKILEKQLSLLEAIDKKITLDKRLQEVQILLQAKMDGDINKVDEDVQKDDKDQELSARRLRLIADNSKEMLEELRLHTAIFKRSFGLPTQTTSSQESKNEQAQENKKTQGLLEEIRDNLRLSARGKGQKIEGLGTGGLAIGLGAIAGTITAQFAVFVDTLKLIGKLLPSSVVTKIKGALIVFKNIGTDLAVLGGTIKDLLKMSLGPMFQKIGSFFRPIVTAFNRAFVLIRRLWTPLEEFIGGISKISGKMGAFGKIFKLTARAVSKLMYPLTIIMGVWDSVKGFIEGFKEGGLVGGIKGAIVGLFNGLVFGFADMIKDMVSWVLNLIGLDSISGWLDSFSFQDMFKKLMDVVFWIPEKLQDMIMAIPGALADFGNFLLEWPKAIFSFVGNLGDAFGKMFSALWDYLATIPDLLVDNVVEPLKGLFDEYIVQPFKKIFDPVVNFFSNLKEQIFGMFEDVGIPEISFTIPIINKKVAIGPFYPFRPEEGSTRISSNVSLKTESNSSGEKSSFKQNSVGSGSVRDMTDKNGNYDPNGPVKYTKDTTVVSMVSKETKDDKGKIKEVFAEFDPKTGKSTVSGSDFGEGKEISKRAFRRIKKSAQSGGDAAAVADIVKEDEMYQKLTWLDRRKVDLGIAKASDLYNIQLLAEKKDIDSKLKNDKQIKAEDLGEGRQKRTYESGGYSISSGEGTKRYDSEGNLIYHDKPGFKGIKQREYANGLSETSMTRGDGKFTKLSSNLSGEISKSGSVDLGAAVVSSDGTGRMATGETFNKKNVGQVVSKASADAVAAEKASSSQPIIVNAPTNVSSNNKQNIALPKPVRNSDSSFGKYIGVY